MIAQLAADEKLRQREFPICARKIYCAHAADAPLPRRVAEAMGESIERASIDARNWLRRLAQLHGRLQHELAAASGAFIYKTTTSLTFVTL